MEINHATAVEEHIGSDVKALKKLILKIEAIAKVCRIQPAPKVKKEFESYVEELETLHFNANQTLEGDSFKE